jgi:murein DD-endopeptidase MepM/ murein hydrolase activator NlpD
MAVFPLRSRPKESYKERPRSFGSSRAKGTRKHAGCDLYASPGAPVLAIEDGKVVRGKYLFYDVVYAIEVQHPSGIVRYGEISDVAEGIHEGVEVKAGQVLGYVGKMKTVAQSMLHIEMYSGTEQGPLTDKRNAPYMRRKDLVDPTPTLDACEVAA